MKSNARKLERETPHARQTHLNQERNPPTVSAPVFEWVPCDDEPSQLVRKAVLKAERVNTLGYYGVNQR